ncbi:hypothetical protein D3C77_677190 [compost metagenome]
MSPAGFTSSVSTGCADMIEMFASSTFAFGTLTVTSWKLPVPVMLWIGTIFSFRWLANISLSMRGRSSAVLVEKDLAAVWFARSSSGALFSLPSAFSPIV